MSAADLAWVSREMADLLGGEDSPAVTVGYMILNKEPPLQERLYFSQNLIFVCRLI